MNANYLFDLFEYNDKVAHAAGLDIALAMYVVEHPLPDGMTEDGTVAFINGNYDKLVAAYAKHDQRCFTETVNQLVGQDAQPQA